MPIKMDLNLFYDHRYVYHKIWEDYVLFAYTRDCVYDSAWDDITSMARGIIFNRHTGELVARPYPKFFNLGEKPETELDALPDEPFIVLDKADGSLGIQFFHAGEPYIATSGSFQSDQAQWATEWIRKNAHTEACKKGYTYLYEIIYPENKIVVDYKGLEACILTGVINNDTGYEMSYYDMKKEAFILGVPVIDRLYGFDDIKELAQYTKSLPDDREGFVVTFSSGLKIKIKSDAYKKIHAIISHMSPLDYWRVWDIEKQRIPDDYLKSVPEELKSLSDYLLKSIHKVHMDKFEEIKKSLEILLKDLGPNYTKKELSLEAKKRHPKTYHYMLDLYNKMMRRLWRKIHKDVRPTNNKLPGGFIYEADMIKRILSEK